MEQQKGSEIYRPADTAKAIRKCVGVYITIALIISFLIGFFSFIAFASVGMTGEIFLSICLSVLIGGFGYMTGMLAYGFADIVDYVNRKKVME